MATSANAPCRLYVFLAREAPIGVVLRRGPAAWVQLSVWHTDTDTFEHGQWFRGRVYERRCDVSADGALFVYFAHKSSSGATVSVDSWAAVSRPPWFTALALWEIGTTYFAGGVFPPDGTLWLSWLKEAPNQGALPPWLTLADAPPHTDRTPDWPDRTAYFSRLLRDGWTPLPSAEAPKTWQRRAPGGDTTLIMDAAAPRDAEYALLAASGELRTFGRATWADWDHRGRLVLAQDGCLLLADQSGGTRIIEDFNANRPDPEAAPAWARSWPERA